MVDRLEEQLPNGKKYYRMGYNIIALLTLLPVLLYTAKLRGPIIFAWGGGWRLLQVLVAVAGMGFLIAGARRYDIPQFLGIRQIQQESSCTVLTEDCNLDTGGVLGMVRHPWYSGGMLIVWARPLDMAAILTNIVITGYFFLGALLEERKLLVQFGRQYADYRQRVSMFFPVKWVLQRFGGH
jgi:protein-S-isoprenylcysteine O-methyltransferase Ste14